MLVQLFCIAYALSRTAIAVAQVTSPQSPAAQVRVISIPTVTSGQSPPAPAAVGPGVPPPPSVLPTRLSVDLVPLPVDSVMFYTSLVTELPKFLTAAVTAILALLVAQVVTKSWDLAKKRNEFDLLLTKDYYDAMGTFKALGRQLEALGAAPTGDAAQARWQTRKDQLLEQAIGLEARIDSILAKVIVEDRADPRITETERKHRRHVAGLLRVSVRNLREGIQRNDLVTPEFGSAEFWLSNRLVSDIGEILQKRALEPAKLKRKASTYSSDYLEMIDLRTLDLQAAAAKLVPYVRAFGVARADARQEARRRNVEAHFDEDQFAMVTALGGATTALDARVVLAVELAVDVVSDLAAINAAALVFNDNPGVRSYLLLADRGPRAIIVGRTEFVSAFGRIAPVVAYPGGPPLTTVAPTAALPDTFPWKPTVARPVRAVELLRWDLNTTAQSRLYELAAVKLTDS